MKYRIEYTVCGPDGIAENHLLYHPRPLTMRGLKLVLQGLGKERNAQHLERIVGQWKLER